MRLETVLKYPNYKAFWVEDGNTLATNGFSAYQLQRDGTKVPVGSLRTDLARKLLARWRPIRHGARLGLNNLMPLGDGGLLSCSNGHILRKGKDSSTFESVALIRHGNRPATRGLCVCPDGTAFFGEYSLNRNRTNPVGVFRSDDSGRTWQLVFEFSPGIVRHIHFIQWDPIGECLWMGTGDRLKECRILRSFDNGVSWDIVGMGSQAWRALGLIFTRDFVVWGTDAGGPDAGTWRSRIMRWTRSDKTAQDGQLLAGPCHSAGRLADDVFVMCTGVEYGKNETDGRAHIYLSDDSLRWTDVRSWGKDFWPLRITFGLIHLPHVQDEDGLLHFTTLGLKSAGHCYHVARVVK